MNRQNIKKRPKTKRMLSLWLALILVTVSVISYSASNINTNPDSYEKISNELLQKMTESDDETVSVYIFLKDCDKDILRDMLKLKGYNFDYYENEALYYENILPELLVDGVAVKDLVDKSNINPKSLRLSSNDSAVDISLRQKVNQVRLNDNLQYTSVYRKCISEIITEYVSSFIQQANASIVNVIQRSPYVEAVIADVKKADIQKIASMPIVTGVGYFYDFSFESSSWNSTQVTATDSNTGLASSLYNYGSGYDGSGIPIGVIETEGKFDPNNYNLTNANVTFVATPGVPTAPTSNHATSVVSLICGKETTISGKKYRGVAPSATVYQTYASQFSQWSNAVATLCDLNVKIINFSGEYNSGSGYNSFDQWIDDLIENSRVCFVCSAGNLGNSSKYVTTPGKAYNAITVGNLACKMNNYNSSIASPYYVNSGSSTLSASYLTNKPDVVAPGTNIYLPTSATQVACAGTGTSFSAPIVSGIAAMLMQEFYTDFCNPNALKNHIICGADNDLITGTTTAYGALTNESGGGLVNAVKAFEVADSGSEIMGMYSSNTTTPTNYVSYSPIIRLTKGQKLRIVLTFEKEEDIPLASAYGNNIDLLLAMDNTNSSYTVTSSSTTNNVEVIDIVAPLTGSYKIYVRFANSILASTGNDNLHYWISWRKR